MRTCCQKWCTWKIRQRGGSSYHGDNPYDVFVQHGIEITYNSTTAKNRWKNDTNTFFARLTRSGIVIVGKDYKNIRFGFRSKYVLLFSWVICRVIQFCYCFEFIMKSKDILGKPSRVSCFLILTSPDDSVIYNTPKVFQWFPQAGERLIGIFPSFPIYVHD